MAATRAATQPAAFEAAIDLWRRRMQGAQRSLQSLAERLPGTRGLPFLAAARLIGAFGGALGGVIAAGPAQAAELPEDRGDLMYHRYDGGGVEAHGPALLVRKNLFKKVSLSALYYADIVSNASIDVVTTASPYDETRREYGLGVDYAVRDALITFAASRSNEPDYKAESFSLDIAQEFFSGMSTASLGYTYGSDDVGKVNEGFFDQAKHWRYRLGLTQILTPSWLASANFEIVSDDGFLGSPYRTALVFGAAVPERVPRTRTSRAGKLRVIGEVAPNWSVSGGYRYFWDTWDIKAHTFDVGVSRRFGELWLADAYVRSYRQTGALFYSNNATTETVYISRNRQLSSYDSLALGVKATYTWMRVPGKYEIRLHGAVERTQTDFDDFTDVRTGSLYSYSATVLQLLVSASF